MALTDNLIAYYKLDESSGNAVDTIGSNTLTNSNVTYTTSKILNGAVFNGSSAKLTNTSSGLGTASTLTVSMWANFTSTQQGVMLIVDNGSDNAQIQIKANDNAGAGSAGYFNLSTWNGSTSKNVSFNGSYNDGLWKHVVFQLNGATMTIIVDNTTVASGDSGNFAVGLSTIKLGSALSDVQWYNGSIDEVGIWNRVLSASEIDELYNFGNASPYPFNNFTPKIMII